LYADATLYSFLPSTGDDEDTRGEHNAVTCTRKKRKKKKRGNPDSRLQVIETLCLSRLCRSTASSDRRNDPSSCPGSLKLVLPNSEARGGYGKLVRSWIPSRFEVDERLNLAAVGSVEWKVAARRATYRSAPLRPPPPATPLPRPCPLPRPSARHSSHPPPRQLSAKRGTAHNRRPSERNPSAVIGCGQPIARPRRAAAPTEIIEPQSCRASGEDRHEIVAFSGGEGVGEGDSPTSSKLSCDRDRDCRRANPGRSFPLVFDVRRASDEDGLGGDNLTEWLFMSFSLLKRLKCSTSSMRKVMTFSCVNNSRNVRAFLIFGKHNQSISRLWFFYSIKMFSNNSQ